MQERKCTYLVYALNIFYYVCMFSSFLSAGIRRTRAYIALDYAVIELKEVDYVDIFRCVMTLRRLGLNMVQTAVSEIVYKNGNTAVRMKKKNKGKHEHVQMTLKMTNSKEN